MSLAVKSRERVQGPQFLTIRSVTVDSCCVVMGTTVEAFPTGWSFLKAVTSTRMCSPVCATRDMREGHL